MSVLVNFARYFATTKHAGQLYAGSLPYTHHLAAVEGQVRKWFPWKEETEEFPDKQTVDEWHAYFAPRDREAFRTHDPRNLLRHLIAAAWLHDVCEDCGVKRKEIHELFGKFLADLVWSVTNEVGDNRRIRHALTYPKIRANSFGVFLKLCDRIANLEQGGLLLDMYRKEHEDFERSLRTDGQLDPLWDRIRTLVAGPAD